VTKEQKNGKRGLKFRCLLLSGMEEKIALKKLSNKL